MSTNSIPLSPASFFFSWIFDDANGCVSSRSTHHNQLSHSIRQKHASFAVVVHSIRLILRPASRVGKTTNPDSNIMTLAFTIPRFQSIFQGHHMNDTPGTKGPHDDTGQEAQQERAGQKERGHLQGINHRGTINVHQGSRGFL